MKHTFLLKNRRFAAIVYSVRCAWPVKLGTHYPCTRAVDKAVDTFSVTLHCIRNCLKWPK